MRLLPTRWPHTLRTAAVSFVTTIAVAGLLLGAYFRPGQLDSLTAAIDTEVVMIFAPLCALVLAVIVEVTRASFAGLPQGAARRSAAGSGRLMRRHSF